MGGCRATNVSMKKITAIIKPFKLWDMIAALERVNIRGLTITEIKGFGRQKGHTELYRGAPYVADFLPKLYVEIILPEENLEDVMELIMRGARTGRIGDGKIFVFPVERVMRIRTCEFDEDAI